MRTRRSPPSGWVSPLHSRQPVADHQDREPGGGGDQQHRTSTPPSPSRTFSTPRPPRRVWAAAGFRPVDPAVAAEVRDQFPVPAKALDDRRSRRLAHRGQAAVRQEFGQRHPDLHEGHRMTTAITREVAGRVGGGNTAGLATRLRSDGTITTRRCLRRLALGDRCCCRWRRSRGNQSAAVGGRFELAVSFECGSRVVPGDADHLGRCDRPQHVLRTC